MVLSFNNNTNPYLTKNGKWKNEVQIYPQFNNHNSFLDKNMSNNIVKNPPQNKDFFEGIKIEKIRIIIDVENQYETPISNAYNTVVKIKDLSTKYILGIHLFPYMRTLQKVDDFKIILKKGKIKREAQISENQKQQIANFFMNGKPTNGFSCLNFVNLIAGFYPNTGYYNAINEDLEANDCFILYKNNEWLHAAFALDKDIIISMFGPSCLQVTSLEGMKKSYPYNKIVKLVPIKDEKEIVPTTLFLKNTDR